MLESHNNLDTFVAACYNDHITMVRDCIGLFYLKHVSFSNEMRNKKGKSQQNNILKLFVH